MRWRGRAKAAFPPRQVRLPPGASRAGSGRSLATRLPLGLRFCPCLSGVTATVRQSGQPSLSLDPCQGLAPAVRCPWKQPLRWAWASTLSWSPPASLLPPGLSGRVFLSELLMLLSPCVLTLTSVTNPTSLITLNTLSMPAKPNFLCSPAQTSSLLPAE